MAVRIRLTRVGATKRPSYRVVAIDRRRARDGRALEILGFYDPLTDPATVNLETEKIKAWIGKGAQPSETVVKLMRQAEKAATPPAPARPPRATTGAKAARSAATTSTTASATATPATTRPKTTRKARTTSSEEAEAPKAEAPESDATAPAEHEATEPETDTTKSDET